MNSRDLINRLDFTNNQISIIINILKFFVYKRFELEIESEAGISSNFIKNFAISFIFIGDV